VGVKYLSRWLRRLMVHRRVLAGLVGGLAVLIVASSIHGTAEARVSVCTSSGRIAGGTTLTPGLLVLTGVPVGLVPDGALTSPDQAIGRMAGGPIAAGAIVTEDDLVDPAQAEPGNVIIALAVSSPLIGLIHPGDHVSVFLSAPDGSVEVSRGLRVVTVPLPDNSGFLSSDTAGTILVEVPEAVAIRLTANSDLSPPRVAIE